MNDLDKIKLDGYSFINDQRLFMAIKSTDGTLGLDHYGNLIKIENDIRTVLLSGIATGRKNNNDEINNFKPITRSIQDELELKQYLFTYSIGHPYYKENDIEYLKGDSWLNYINSIRDKIIIIDINETNNNQILLLQSNIYLLSKSCNLKGIVVRHGAILLIDDVDIEIRTEFILIESGGLLQAGSNYKNNYRFTKKLKIILTNDKYGYGKAGVVASQYSYLVYSPGVTLYKEAYNYLDKLLKKNSLIKLKDLDIIHSKFKEDIIKYYISDENISLIELKDIILKKSQSSYLGNPYESFCNTFGAKCIGVGFNGNYQLCGMVSADNIYRGTWNIKNSSDNTSYLDENDLMTYYNLDEISKAKISNIETSYPMVWCQLDNKFFNKNSTSITIDTKYINNNFEEWKVGNQIVITCKTKKFTSEKDWIGMIPIWLDNKNEINKEANEKENREFILERYLRRTNHIEIDKDIIIPDEEMDFDNTGVEVVKIKELIFKDNNFTGEIILETPLKFNHNSIKSKLSNNSKDIIVDTNIHVGLLTRNILITSEFNTEDIGCGANRDIWKAINSCACCLENKYNIDYNDKKNWSGPGGSIYSNYLNITDNKDNTNISNAAYIYPRNRDKNKEICKTNINNNNNENEDIDTKYSNLEKPSVIKNGHWIFGTEDIKGCNAIFGGHQMFMYGSSVRLDGVEIKYLGTPSNFGTNGRYPVHFHLSGYTKLYKEYLREIPSHIKIDNIITDKIFCRENEILNCSIWCSFNRWITIHGTHEVNIKNNIGFISYGSGYFIEDGTEQNNTFEHNMAICCLTASKHKYWNPLPIYPNVSSDLAIASAFWFKNNQNRCLRNVICNSPAPIIGIWAVPQNIARLRGQSTVCFGDEILKLAGLGSYFNCNGNKPDNIGLNTYNTDNKNGILYKFTTNTLGWVPNYFEKKFYTDDQCCVAFTGRNSDNPYNLWAENIIYCMFGGMSEFPEALGIPTGDYYGRGLSATANSENIGIRLYDLNYENNKVKLIKIKNIKGIAQFFPFNGQNTCIDDWKTQETYFSTRWGGTNRYDNSIKYRFNPLEKNIIQSIDKNLYHKSKSNIKSITIGEETKSDTVPKIFSNWLIFNCAPNQGSLWGGAGWIKSSPGWLINCCLLADGGGSFVTNPNPNYKDITSNSHTAGYYDKNMSSVWSMTCGDAVNIYSNTYFVIHNLISNGGIGLPPNPTIISGSKTFFSNTSQIMNIEYNNHKASINDYYFIDIDPLKFVNNQFWINTYKSRKIPFRLFTKNNIYWNGITIDSHTKQLNSLTIQLLCDSDIRKYPFIINNNKLFKISDSNNCNYIDINNNNPEWFDIVINSHVGHFINNYGIDLGNSICQYLTWLPSNQYPIQI